MSTHTHTPGPWHVGDAGQTVFGPKIDGLAAPVTIASLPPASPRVAAVERRANARLIASAPDLLEELKSVFATLSDLVADAKAMDKRLLVGQPDPLTAKGSIVRAESRLACIEKLVESATWRGNP